MAPRFEWERGPISGRWILYLDHALWPRAEVQVLGANFLVVLFTAPDRAATVIGRFTLLAEAQARAEQVLVHLTSEGERTLH
jgi:hypothetical protein